MQRPTIDEKDDAWRDWVVSSGARYWPNNAGALEALPVPELARHCHGSSVDVELPAWAFSGRAGAPTAILVDNAALCDGPAPAYQRCDWILAAYLHLIGATERRSQAEKPAFNSYCFQLDNVDTRLFDRAWANWIFIFLRNWAARAAQIDADVLFGRFPAHEIDLTHDVDAVSKTLEIRIKQSAFNLYNAVRGLTDQNFGQAHSKLVQAGRFAFSRGHFWTLSEIREKEERLGLRSTFHFYGGAPGLRRVSPKRILLDPGYDVGSEKIANEIRHLRRGKWHVGLHQRYTAVPDAESMGIEKLAVEAVCGESIDRCRQHWLCFSWDDTWRAQEACGLRLDSTLGFNDRPAFRNGCALRFNPWDVERNRSMTLAAIPMVFMDSHFYDYAQPDEDALAEAMARWLNEVVAVGGIASVCWHTHTLSPDYNWGTGFDVLLELLTS